MPDIFFSNSLSFKSITSLCVEITGVVAANPKKGKQSEKKRIYDGLVAAMIVDKCPFLSYLTAYDFRSYTQNNGCDKGHKSFVLKIRIPEQARTIKAHLHVDFSHTSVRNMTC